MAGGFKDFTAATALSADVDNYLMRQTMMQFASFAAGTAALSGSEQDGMFFVALDTHAVYKYRLSAGGWQAYSQPWVSYTPAWTNLTVGSATVAAKYAYSPGELRVRGQITFAADTSITGTVFQTIPQSITADSGWQGGTGLINDASAPRLYPCVIGVTSSGTTFGWVHAESAGNGLLTATGPVVLTTSDVITWDFAVGL